MEKEITIDTIEELQERWQYLKWQRGIESLLITEHFQKSGETSYVVNGLALDLEEEYVMCYDDNNIIANRFSTLMLFLRQCLTKIMLLPIDGGYRERLEFGENGVIYIEVAS